MASAEQKSALLATYKAAAASGHVWPEYAACEAMVESTWGTSKLFVEANNAFGEKYHEGGAYDAFVTMPTWEVVDGKRVNIHARFVKYASLAACFDDRMGTLVRHMRLFPDYGEALKAKTGEEFVIAVSRKWSTDPDRAKKVLAIHFEHKYLFPIPKK